MFASAASGDDVELWHVWNVLTGRKVAILRGPLDHRPSLSFAPDGRALAITAPDNTVRIWDLATGAENVRFRGHSDEVLSVSFSPDGQMLATGGADGDVKLWGVATRPGPEGPKMAIGGEKATFRGRSGGVLTMSFSPDGRTLAAGSSDCSIRFWDVLTGREIAMARGHSDEVLSMSFSPDGRTLATVGSGHQARLWDVATGRETTALWIPDQLVLRLPSAGRVAIHEIRRVVEPGPFVPGTRCRTSSVGIGFSLDGRVLVSSGTENIVHLRCQDPVALIAPREATRLTGHRLEGFTAVPLDASTYRPTQHLRASKGFSFRPAQPVTPDLNPYLRPSWNEWHSHHWVSGARRGQAKDLYRLALIREREGKDAKARRLHQEAAAVTDPTQKKWAGRSQWRLDHVRWLVAWQPAFKQAHACFASGLYEEGLAVYGTAKGLSDRDRERLACALIADLGTRLSRVSGSPVAAGFVDARFRLLVEHGPAGAALYNAVGLIMEAEAKPTKAVRYYERAIALNPEHAEAHCRLARILQERSRFKEAISHYEKALSFARDDVYLWRSAAFPLFQLLRIDGQKEKAIDVVGRWM